jgi:YegS/Rv2252/BmrU family lipid kinase
MKKKIRFIINPISGVGQKGEIPKLIDENLDHALFDYEISYTQYRKHAKLLAQNSAENGFDVVCAVGGDGSVHEVGTALIGTKTSLGIIPVGSGNGLARHLKIPLDIVSAVKNINNSVIFKMDTVLVNDKPFLGTGGYGFDAQIAKKFENTKTRGFWAYVALVLKEFHKYKTIELHISTHQTEKKYAIVLCTLANSSEFGNGFCVSPFSSVYDGKVEICILKPFPFWKTLFVLYRFFNKTIHKSKYVEILSVEKARIQVENQLAHYDGEPFKIRKELNLEVKPLSLKVLVGKNYQSKIK